MDLYLKNPDLEGIKKKSVSSFKMLSWDSDLSCS